LLGNNTRGGAVVLRPIRLQCVGVWISTGLPGVQLTIRILNSDVCKIRRKPHHPELSRYVRRKVFVLKKTSLEMLSNKQRTPEKRRSSRL
jgi:hypothetical protein